MKVTVPSPNIVKIGWELGDSNGQWDEACMYAVEMFGLPGDKFKTCLTEEYMEFEFMDSKDAILFAIRWS